MFIHLEEAGAHVERRPDRQAAGRPAFDCQPLLACVTLLQA